MRIRRLGFVIVILLTARAVAGQQSESAADVQLKAAIHTEVVDGDLRAAIEAYKSIVSRYAGNRAVAAKALLQLAGCYEKLGQAQARTTYEQLLREYGDQAEPVAQARSRLAALGGRDHAAAPTTPVVVALPRRVDGVNVVEALSPDGTKALFLSVDKGLNLAVYDFATRRATLLTNFDWTTASSSHGAWSADGRRVAFTQSGPGPDAVAELRVATLDGNSRVIFRNDANPGRSVAPASWLPDGRTLLVVLERTDRTSAIGLVPVAGGPFTALRSFSWVGKVSRPRVSPDGRFVAFADGAAGTRDIRVLTVDGRTAYQITEHPADESEPVWSPDGRHIVFISTRVGGAALWAVPMKDGQAAGDPVRIRDGMQGVELIDWTARGLTYMERVQTYDIYTASIDRSTWQPAADPRQFAYPRTGRNIGPVWSPDGHQLAFISGSATEPDRRHVVIIPEGRGDPREYVIPTTRYSNVQDPYDLRWFGDGSGLGFSGTDRQGQPAVFQLSLATGQWKTYPSPVKTWTRLEWNADGTKYFYARQAMDGESPAIIEHDLAKKVEREVFKPRGERGVFRGLRLSPDRRSLAFTLTTVTDGRPTLALMVADLETSRTGTLMEETSGTTMETSVTFGAPAWSPDGRALIVPRTVGADMWPEFRVVPLDGGSIRSFALKKSLAGRTASGAGNQAPAIRDVNWSPDGAEMAFVLSANRMDAWTIENVLAGVGTASKTP